MAVSSLSWRMVVRLIPVAPSMGLKSTAIPPPSAAELLWMCDGFELQSVVPSSWIVTRVNPFLHLANEIVTLIDGLENKHNSFTTYSSICRLHTKTHST